MKWSEIGRIDIGQTWNLIWEFLYCVMFNVYCFLTRDNEDTFIPIYFLGCWQSNPTQPCFCLKIKDLLSIHSSNSGSNFLKLLGLITWHLLLLFIYLYLFVYLFIYFYLLLINLFYQLYITTLYNLNLLKLVCHTEGVPHRCFPRERCSEGVLQIFGSVFLHGCEFQTFQSANTPERLLLNTENFIYDF